jgi:hypothetical protein
MPQDRMMQAIGRMDRALARLENADLSRPAASDEPSDLQQRHVRLKQEAQSAIADIDRLLSQVRD